MSDLIKREDVLAIIDGRFSGMMIGDILKQDINALPEAEMQIAGRQCRIDRCELFNRLATITAEDANDMKAKIYAVIQEMPAIPERMLQPVHVHIDKEKTEEILEKIREEYELVDDIVRCKECDMSEVYQSDSNGVMARYCKAFTPTRMVADDDYCSYGERKCSEKPNNSKEGTEKPKIRKRIDKPFRAVWLDDNHNEIGTPQTERSE